MEAIFTPGRYNGRVEQQRFLESSQRGTLGFCLTFRLQKNLDDPSMDVKPLERELTIWITERTIKRALNDLHRLGYPGKTLTGLDPDTEGFHSLAGREIEVVCTHESGSWGNSFERWNLAPPDKSNLENKAKLKAFDRLLGRSQDQINGRASDDAVDDFDHGITDADVPF